MPRGVPITPALEAIVLAAYPRHKHNAHIAHEVGITPKTVTKILRRHGLDSYPSKHAAVIDETFFDHIDTPEKAYFFGWMLSDGSNVCAYRQVKLRLKSTDIGVLIKLKRLIGFGGNLNVYTEQPSSGSIVLRPKPSERAALQFTSERLSRALERLGCVANKTRQLVFPTSEAVPSHLISHFMRGYVEGDGSFGAYDHDRHYIFQLQGTKAFIETAVQVIEVNTGARCVVTAANKTNWFFKAAKTGRRPVLAILDWLYRDCDDMFLERKHQTFQRMRQAYDALPNEPYIDPVTHRWVPGKWPKGKMPVVEASV